MANVLITGGAGFIGSRVAERLASAGHRLLVVDNFAENYSTVVKRTNIAALQKYANVTFVQADIRDAAKIEQLTGEHHVERICHLAAMTNVRTSIDHPALFFDVNVSGTAVLLEAARKHGIQLFVSASTSSVYGNETPVPFVETAAADRPLAPYPATKRAAEILAHAYFNMYQLPVTVLRFFNVYGPHGRPDMMPLRVMDALVQQREITRYNEGELWRDWTYIDDIVRGIVAALERPLGYEIINLGCGEPVQLNDFIHILEGLTGRSAIIRDVPAPASELRMTYCDNTKARELLGFEPKTRLADGLAQTWAWYRQTLGV